MVELRLLGSIRLRSSDGRDVDVLARHAKRTALLAYLGAASPRGPHRRDTLLALFWPESDTARARAALNQALYVLRSALGEDAIVSRGDGDVALNGDLVWCDVTAFEAALDSGRPEEALALYPGDLLEGFFISDAPDFERWVERERARLRERAAHGAWALAEERAEAGDAMDAGRWARRAAEFSSLDEAVVRRLIAFFGRLGDRAAAVRAYDAFAARLAQEFAFEPSAETRRLAETIRRAAAVVPSAPAPESNAAVASPAPTRASLSNRVGRKPRAIALALLVAGLLTGGGFLVRARLDARAAARTEAPKRLAVLPFANLGPAEDGYLADGIADEIAARLGASDRLLVIGHASASRYKQTDKTPAQIGSELGASYVLQGSVRWEKPPRGPARVRVTPQLVSAADGTQLWAQIYDEPLDEIFRVQSDIAERVVQALDIRLLDPQRRIVDAAPTRNIEAYDYYLRGNDFSRRGQDDRFQRAAVRMYEQAVALDSGFALAYAMLSRADARMYLLYLDHSRERLAQAKWAVDRAFRLQPDLPEAHHSLGTYYWIALTDYEQALHEYAITEASRPHDPNLFTARAVLQGRQGKYREAFTDFARARELDPGSASVFSNYGELCDLTHDFARAESLYDRAIALAPDGVRPYVYKTGLYLRRDGSVWKARAVLDEAQTVGLGDAPEVILARAQVAILGRRYGDAILQLSSDVPPLFVTQQYYTPRVELLAEAYSLMHRRDVARAYFDSARSAVQEELRRSPDDARLHSALGVAYAGLGWREEAIREGKRGVELRPISKDTYQGYHREWDLARIYVMVGEHEAALERLEYLLSIPGYLTPAWLRIDPTWDALRSHGRFQRLLTGTH
ncbi:MAG TPA: BTAD domain-containing putative transcriptional regulator [Gemmatimonadales bacterium]|nr:BTAD domain-containing putative transcriptional regulator [Gemmatimonadales bacterium]